jgi:hypothetical protein
MRKYGDKELSEAQRAYNRYVIVVRSITDAAPEMILDVYRQRRQLFTYHEIPVHVEASARAWFYGKLLLAALCETRVNVNRGRFSPSGGKGPR